MPFHPTLASFKARVTHARLITQDKLPLNVLTEFRLFKSYESMLYDILFFLNLFARNVC